MDWPQFGSMVFGALLSLSGTLLVWKLRERSDRQRLRVEKLEALIKAIHRANILATVHNGGYNSPQAERETENAVNEIDMLVTLHFTELQQLSDRVGKAFTLTLMNPSRNSLISELRGLEQDTITLWRGAGSAVLDPDRKLPQLET